MGPMGNQLPQGPEYVRSQTSAQVALTAHR